MNRPSSEKSIYVRWFQDLTLKDTAEVGSKNASLGELMGRPAGQEIPVPPGFAVTSRAYSDLLLENNLSDKIHDLSRRLAAGELGLEQAGQGIRRLFRNARFPERLEKEIHGAYVQLSRLSGVENLDVSVRSSATAEDLAEASFAGMLESFLNVSGQAELLKACLRCYASLFTDRAIRYRQEMGFDPTRVAMSIGIQRMVRADQAGAGVMFSVDNKTGFPDMVVITAAWGLGENVVQGAVIPDEYHVYKPFLQRDDAAPIIEKSLGEKEWRRVYRAGEQRGTRNIPTSEDERAAFVLNDREILQLARWARAIEDHYGRAMDMEWAKDGKTGPLVIVQARPVTAQAPRVSDTIPFTRLKRKETPFLSGVSIGDGIVTGKAMLIQSFGDIDRFARDGILVAEMANTGWTGLLKDRAARAVVSDFGGRNSHAAIVCRELGIPGVLGTREATSKLQSGQEITLTSVDGDDGFVYRGLLEYLTEEIPLKGLPETGMRVMMNVPSDAAALQWWRMPCDGIGLVRMDQIFRHLIQVHPMALIRFEDVKDPQQREEIERLTRAYRKKSDFFIETVSSCLAQIAATRYPAPVLVRLSDMESKDFASLMAGARFEPGKGEEGFLLRGVGRYLGDHYRPVFDLECEAIRMARETKGFRNLQVMVPHCHSLEDADRILDLLEKKALGSSEDGVKPHLSCDHHVNFTQAGEFAGRFQGFSMDVGMIRRLIRSWKDHETKNGLPEEMKEDSIEAFITRLIDVAHGQGCPVSIRGRTFKRSRSLVTFFVEAGVDALSVNPEAIPGVKRWIASAEKKR